MHATRKLLARVRDDDLTSNPMDNPVVGIAVWLILALPFVAGFILAYVIAND